MHSRRALLLAALSMLATFFQGPPAGAQPSPAAGGKRIGWLSAGHAPADVAPYREALRQALVGYVNLQQQAVIEERHAAGRLERLPAYASELARAKVSVILAVGNDAVRAARQATSTIPIVMIASDPVVAGLVRSLDDPGGNLTGVAVESPELHHRRLRILKELVPTLSVVAVISNRASAASVAEFQGIEHTAKALAVKPQPLDARDVQTLQTLLTASKKEAAAGAVLVPAEPWTVSDMQGVIGLMAKLKIPAVYPMREFVDAGGLIAYGPNLVAMYRRAGSFVGKVLGGARPQGLAIDRPSRAELVVNVRAARALGLTVPRTLLNTADRIID